MPDNPLPQDLSPSASPSDPYEQIVGRNSVDLVLRDVHQQLVAVSSQADLKANIMITVSSILISIAATRLDDRDLRPGLITLMVFLLVALVFAVVAVLPKFRIAGARRKRRPPEHFDPLFFGHFAEMEKGKYLDEMAGVLRSDAALYRTLVGNLHNQGSYLMSAKYRFLALSYLWFLSGFVVAGIVLLATLVSD